MSNEEPTNKKHHRPRRRKEDQPVVDPTGQTPPLFDLDERTAPQHGHDFDWSPIDSSLIPNPYPDPDSHPDL